MVKMLVTFKLKRFINQIAKYIPSPKSSPTPKSLTSSPTEEEEERCLKIVLL